MRIANVSILGMALAAAIAATACNRADETASTGYNEPATTADQPDTAATPPATAPATTASADAETPTSTAPVASASTMADATTSFDDMVDRAPDGRLQAAGGAFKHAYRANWKLYLENLCDAAHPLFTHQSSIDAAQQQSDDAHSDGSGEIAIRQMRQNGAPYSFWESKVGIWTYPNGHSFLSDYHDDSKLVAALNDHPDIRLVEIAGHTDEQGDEAYNLDLSTRRAAAVLRYLTGKGIDPQRLESQGYGESDPKDPRHTQAAYAKNRRVEFLILKRDGGL